MTNQCIHYLITFIYIYKNQHLNLITQKYKRITESEATTDRNKRYRRLPAFSEMQAVL